MDCQTRSVNAAALASRPATTGYRTSRSRAWLAVFLCLSLATSSGCATGRSAVWRSPPIPSTTSVTGNPAEIALATAAHAEQLGQANATDLYYHTAILAWQQMTSGQPGNVQPPSPHLQAIYKHAIGRWLETAQHYGRWIPGQGIDVSTEVGMVRIPIAPTGFPWEPEEFEELHPIGEYESPSLSRYHRQDGLGSPLVVRKCNRTELRPGDRFLPRHVSFSATALLRPQVNDGTGGQPAVLELWNPYTTHAVPGPSGTAGLATDTSAVFAFRELSLGSVPTPFEMFVRPDEHRDSEGLYFFEPHQPGKIPVLFVHGLMSSPRTWIDMANELRANPEFNARYQIWAFDYATGKNFLRAAAELRQALCEADAELAAYGDDPSRHQMVLVGHSMGGLVSKMQVTRSGTHLWDSIANLPLDQVQMNDQYRRQLAKVFFFEPLPQVQRVVFIATPHRGSALASRLTGRWSSALIRRSPFENGLHQQLIVSNPGVFRWSVFWRFPNSIDMLEPEHPLAQAVDDLPISDHVKVHTIAGTGYMTTGFETGDRVVPLSSAVHCRAETELQIKATHTHIHRTPEAVNELLRILAEHPY
ncbi:esterase/lipase family protein [Schlesneria sp. T3-172]|uniref:esterase/lipase family protein n=2 Tax=Schlesneria TaxID=656899 RepID=UPI0037C9CEC3